MLLHYYMLIVRISVYVKTHYDMLIVHIAVNVNPLVRANRAYSRLC